MRPKFSLCTGKMLLNVFNLVAELAVLANSFALSSLFAHFYRGESIRNCAIEASHRVIPAAIWDKSIEINDKDDDIAQDLLPLNTLLCVNS